MRINAIRVKNFRAYYKEHEIEFPHDPKRNINIVLAQNEVGKTTLLSAVLFCFYGRLTHSAEDPDQLMNIEALRAGDKAGYCEVDIIHPNDLKKPNPDIYRIRRNFTDKGSEKLPVGEILDGITSESRNYHDPFDLINSLIPEAISDYFFIDGEGIHNIVGDEILLREAIRNIQGLTAAEDSKQDLEKLRVKKNTNFKKLTANNSELEKINSKIIKKDEKIAEIKEKKIPYISEKTRIDNELRQARIKLRECNIADIDILVKREEALIKNVKRLDANIDKAEIRKRKISGEYSSHIFSQSFLGELDKFIEEKGSVGELPSGYEEIFVNRLLEKKVCICGKKFSEHSDEFKNIQNLLNDAKTQGFENRMFSIKGKINDYLKKFKDFGVQMHDIQESLAEDNKALKDDQKELLENQEQQRGHDQKKIQTLRKKVDDLEGSQFKLTTEMTKADLQIESLNKEIKELNKERNKLVGSKAGIQNELNEIAFLDEAIEFLEDVIFETEEGGKSEIEEIMNNLLTTYARGSSRFKFKPGSYYPMILNSADEIETDDEDALRKLKQPLSGGGAAVKRNIFFACSLINQSKSRMSDKDEFIIQGTTAPMVVDAPFSNLDSYNTEMIANLLFETADQLIIFMSNSAWIGAVKDLSEDEFRDKINSLHYLTRSFKGKAEGRSSLPIDISKKLKNIDTVSYNAEIETSQIHKVEIN